MARVRFIIKAGSQSAHCCFTHTVVDTGRPNTVAGETVYETMCETFDEQSAQDIVAALNQVEPELS